MLTSQTGVVPEHWLCEVAEHCPHAPFGWHAGALSGHWVSAVQPVHTPAATLQTGVAPVHAEAFEAEHWPQAPVA